LTLFLALLNFVAANSISAFPIESMAAFVHLKNRYLFLNIIFFFFILPYANAIIFASVVEPPPNEPRRQKCILARISPTLL